MEWSRRIGYVVVGSAVIAALGYGFMPQPIQVEVIPVRRGPLRAIVEEEGRTRVIDRFALSAPVPGFARRIEVHVGDAVAAGQILARLEPLRSNVLDARSRAEAEAQLSAARAAFQAAQESATASAANADLAAAERERMHRLFTIGDASKERMDHAEAEWRRTTAAHRSAEFAVEVSRFEVQAAETALRYSAADDGEHAGETVDIRAPVAGSVLRVLNESERVVMAGEALVEIGNPRALEVEIDVLSADAVRLHPGTRVVYERWGGEQPLEGRVRLVEPVGFTKVSALGVEEQRVLVIADIASDPALWERLGDGYRVDAAFILWEGDDVLQVPASALFRSGAGWAVFVMEDGRARRRDVELGHHGELTVEVRAGLEDGQLVIPHPDDALEDGTAVRVWSAERTQV